MTEYQKAAFAMLEDVRKKITEMQKKAEYEVREHGAIEGDQVLIDIWGWSGALTAIETQLLFYLDDSGALGQQEFKH